MKIVQKFNVKHDIREVKKLVNLHYMKRIDEIRGGLDKGETMGR